MDPSRLKHRGLRYLTEKELDEWYEAIGAIRRCRHTRHAADMPAAVPTPVSQPIKMELTVIGGVLYRMPEAKKG